MVEGHEVWHLKCLGCGRTVKHPADPKNPNALVGKQRRLRCSKCGHLGAEITRVWTVGPAPKRR
jgi:DNA-directed RNA polymerase subunit RPC12/RpoP